ncbi:uncharacterized protein LOC129919994 [Episyrphus balteatus]|uniref:uncharacterized protein LOC129919994 n=1 Tax=Episyrphus balteatus TaxID=286459 RepID=UPI002485A798|nr:uncharacterized protein LOC129919994 [Episyrphus balteatus]XP_055857117.1 uncharacterized protein LOC129919994 [Episyrphus balteatus]
MIWAQTILLLVLGVLVAGSWQNVQGEKSFNLKIRNSTHGRPGNKTHYYSVDRPALVDNALYMKFACQGKQNGFRLPIEGSCTQYLECQRGSPKVMTCNNGKHFSVLGLACIDAKLSKCHVKCECCGKADGIYPDVKNCSNFIVCIKEKAHQQSCGEIFKFNADKLMCDIPQRTKCHTVMSNSTHSLERQVIPLPKIYKTPMYLTSYKVCHNKSNGYTVGVAGSCNKFYLCINGKGYLKSCGSMQFNAEAHYCDAKTRIHCPEFSESDLILESDENPQVIPEVPETIDDLQPPHREPGKPFPQEQVPNEIPLEPPVVGYPDQPYMPNHPERPPNHQGHNEIPKPPVAIEPVPPTIFVPDVEEVIDPKKYAGLCANQSVGALIAMPQHCNKYIRCRWDWYERRVAVLESCPKNKHFNAKSKMCDVPQKAGCALILN